MSSEAMHRIRVLVVDDSPVVRELIVHVLERDPAIEVVGTASNGDEAVRSVVTKKPDVITMDFHMPKMDGLKATRTIMETHPVPIIMTSLSVDKEEAINVFHALEAGAVAIICPLVGVHHADYEKKSNELIQMVKAMSEVKVVRRWPRDKLEKHKPGVGLSIPANTRKTNFKLVAMGASTGGPVVLKTILSGLPKPFPWPILIVQHIAYGFTKGLIDWLNQCTRITTHLAESGDIPQAGHAYIAPQGHHMLLAKNGSIDLSTELPENGHRPSVSTLFRSVAEHLGRSAIGVLLTGMGKDGAAELKLMKEKGALTLVQSKETTVVNGMPGEAVRLDAASMVLSPDEMAVTLSKLVESQGRENVHEM